MKQAETFPSRENKQMHWIKRPWGERSERPCRSMDFLNMCL